MSPLTRLAVSRPWFVTLSAIFVMLAGGYAVTRLNAELIPEIDFPIVTVVTVYPGAGPSDVAEEVSKPIEDAIAGFSGLRNLQSTSAADVSLVVAEFAYGTDMKKAEATISTKVNEVGLPDGAQKPQVARVDPNSFPVVRLGVSGDGDLVALETLVRNQLQPALATVPGVQSLRVIGGAGRRVSVLVSPAKAKEKGVSLQQIASLLQANNITLPGGNVTVGGEQVAVRTTHSFASLDEIANLVVGVSGMTLLSSAVAGGSAAPVSAVSSSQQLPTQAAAGSTSYVVKPGDNLSALARQFGTSMRSLAEANRLANPDLILAGQSLLIPLSPQPTRPGPTATAAPSSQMPVPVTLTDVADVRIEVADAAVVRTNGRAGIAIEVTKRQDANVVKVAHDVIAQVEAFGKANSSASVDVVYDGSSAVQSSIDGLLREGAMGALLAVAVVFIFLTSMRGALTVAVSIPMSLLVAFLAMWWQGFMLNIMTLAGLAVAVGRVVDDSIVVCESILRQVHAGEPLDEAVRAGTASVISPITSSTLTTVVVFLPLGLVGGLAGQVFRPFALTVSFSLLASLVCAVTVIPALSKVLVPNIRHTAANGEGGMQMVYAGVLRWSMARKPMVLAVAAALFFGSLAAIPYIPRSFLPSE